MSPKISQARSKVFPAKLIVLRNLWLEKKGLPITEEEEALQKLAQDFLQNK